MDKEVTPLLAAAKGFGMRPQSFQDDNRKRKQLATVRLIWLRVD